MPRFRSKRRVNDTARLRHVSLSALRHATGIIRNQWDRRWLRTSAVRQSRLKKLDILGIPYLNWNSYRASRGERNWNYPFPVFKLLRSGVSSFYKSSTNVETVVILFRSLSLRSEWKGEEIKRERREYSSVYLSRKWRRSDREARLRAWSNTRRSCKLANRLKLDHITWLFKTTLNPIRPRFRPRVFVRFRMHSCTRYSIRIRSSVLVRAARDI